MFFPLLLKILKNVLLQEKWYKELGMSLQKVRPIYAERA